MDSLTEITSPKRDIKYSDCGLLIDTDYIRQLILSGNTTSETITYYSRPDETRHIISIGTGHETITINCYDDIYNYRLLLSPDVKTLIIKAYGGRHVGPITLTPKLENLIMIGVHFHTYDVDNIYEECTRDGDKDIVIPHLPLNLTLIDCSLGAYNEDYDNFSSYKQLHINNLDWHTYNSCEDVCSERDFFYDEIVPAINKLCPGATFASDTFDDEEALLDDSTPNDVISRALNGYQSKMSIGQQLRHAFGTI